MSTLEAPLLLRKAEEIRGSEAVDKFAQLADLAVDNPFKNGTYIDPEDLESIRGEKVANLITDREIRWPLNNILGAVGFVSWDEGRGPKHLKDGKTSREVMQDYASRESEIPGVNFGLDVYFYTDDEGQNRLFAVSHNAHRVGAAKFKSLRDIPVSGKTSVYHLSELPEQLHR